MTGLLAVLALALAAAGWGALQLWIARHDPGNPGLDRTCDGSCRSCDQSCGPGAEERPSSGRSPQELARSPR